jgi:hypothetical protein
LGVKSEVTAIENVNFCRGHILAGPS